MCARDDLSESFLLNDCMCNGTEESLLDCNTTMDVADCIASEAVMVNCTGKLSAIRWIVYITVIGRYTCVEQLCFPQGMSCGNTKEDLKLLSTPRFISLALLVSYFSQTLNPQRMEWLVLHVPPWHETLSSYV